MPRDNIDRAISRGSGAGGGAQLEELLYEGFGAGGVAVLVESLTDNRNRTAPEVRKVFEKRGGNLAAGGAVSWMFERKALFFVARDPGSPESGLSEDQMMEAVLELGAEDLVSEDEVFEIRGEVGGFHRLAKGLEDRGIEFQDARIAWIPKSTVEVSDPTQARQVLELIRSLEDLDDVQVVSSNYDIPTELLAELG